MRYSLSTIFALLSFAGLANAANQIDKEIVSPYVQIFYQEWTGAGVVIDVKGEKLVLTAKHVVDGEETECQLFKVDDLENTKTLWRADVVYKSDKYDLALVKPRNTSGLVAANYLGNVALERGQDVWYIGSPKGEHAFLERTIVNRPFYELAGYNSDFEGKEYKHLILNGNAWYGNSGGPVFAKVDGKYVVVGIVTRLVWVDPRTPIACETQNSITAVLESYLASK